MNQRDNITWLNDAVIYEPAPLPRGYGRAKPAKFWRVFLILAVLAVSAGALIALSH
jgi:uracil-DNA glycosylase